MAKILEMKAAAAKRLAPPACGKCASGDDGSFAAYVPGKYAYPPAASIRRAGRGDAGVEIRGLMPGQAVALRICTAGAANPAWQVSA